MNLHGRILRQLIEVVEQLGKIDPNQDSISCEEVRRIIRNVDIQVAGSDALLQTILIVEVQAGIKINLKLSVFSIAEVRIFFRK